MCSDPKWRAKTPSLLTSFCNGAIFKFTVLECYRSIGLDQLRSGCFLCASGPHGGVPARLVCFLGGGRLRVKKVINNNILCVVDDKGSEMIVTGKGLGFKRKTGERVDPALVKSEAKRS